MELGAFLVAIAGELIKLGQTLFSRYDGDVAKAVYNIQDRRKQIEEDRAAIDKALSNKHEGSDEDAS